MSKARVFYTKENNQNLVANHAASKLQNLLNDRCVQIRPHHVPYP